MKNMQISNCERIFQRAEKSAKNKNWVKAAREYTKAEKCYDQIDESDHISALCHIEATLSLIKGYAEHPRLANKDNYYLFVKEAEGKIKRRLKEKPQHRIELLGYLEYGYAQLETLFRSLKMQRLSDKMYIRFHKIHTRRLFYQIITLKKNGLRKKSRFNLTWRFLANILFGLIGYGARIWLLIVNLCIIILSTGLLYWHYGLAGFSKGSSEPTFIESLYFSVVTLTTLGFGDIEPRCTTGMVVVCIEVIAGYFGLGVLVASIGRKIRS